MNLGDCITRIFVIYRDHVIFSGQWELASVKCEMWWHTRRNQISSLAKWTSPFKSAGGRQFSRLPAAEVCASAVEMLDTPCSEVVWRVLATHCIRQFPVHFPYRASPCAIAFQLVTTSHVFAVQYPRQANAGPLSVDTRFPAQSSQLGSVVEIVAVRRGFLWALILSFVFLTEAIALCSNKFVYYIIFRQYATIYQYSDIIYTLRPHYGNMFRP